MFTRTSDSCVARFGEAEATVLHAVLADLVALLAEDLDRTDPVVARLFPDTYREDPAGSAELRRYTEDDLRSAKLEAAMTLLDTLPQTGGQVSLGEEQAAAWLRALTDVRLTLGLRLDITDDTDLIAAIDDAVLSDPMSPRAGQLSVYAYLTFLQESLIAALAG